jgi:predicted PurR-regulated permease PerM
MKRIAETSSFLIGLIGAASFVIVIAGMRAASSLLVPFLLSLFIATIIAPSVFWLKRRRIPTVLAIMIVVICFLIIILIITAMIGTSIDDFSRALPVYQEKLQEKTQVLFTWFENMGIDLSKEELGNIFDPGIAMKLARDILSSLGGVLTNGFFILLTVIFILLEASGFPEKLNAALTDPGSFFESFDKIAKNIQTYIVMKTWVSLGTGIVVAIWLTILGVDYSLLWGLFAFLLNYVPNIGSIIAAVPAVLLALIQLGTGFALLTMAGYLVVNVLFGSVIEPRIMGRGLGLSTLVIFLSLVFWGWVFGPIGMLLSVPLTMIIKIVLDSQEATRPIAILLGADISAAKAAPSLSGGDHEEDPSSEQKDSS